MYMILKTIDGKQVRVDDDNADLLNRIRWRIAPNGYVYATVYLHRLVMKAPLNMHVNHKDWDKGHCTRSNLEIVTPSENAFKRRKNTVRTKRRWSNVKPHSSMYTGVSHLKKLDNWRATFRRRHLGTFKTEKAAAEAYLVAMKAYINE